MNNSSRKITKSAKITRGVKITGAVEKIQIHEITDCEKTILT